jgi:hypothetical protein
MLAEAWDFFLSDGGKVVWCEVRIPPFGDRRLPQRTQTTATTSRIPLFTDLAILERVRAGLWYL